MCEALNLESVATHPPVEAAQDGSQLSLDQQVESLILTRERILEVLQKVGGVAVRHNVTSPVVPEDGDKVERESANRAREEEEEAWCEEESQVKEDQTKGS